MAKNTRTVLVPVEHIASSILVLRGHGVILDRDLDSDRAAVLSAIRQLLNASRPKRRPIGFTVDLDGKA